MQDVITRTAVQDSLATLGLELSRDADRCLEDARNASLAFVLDGKDKDRISALKCAERAYTYRDVMSKLDAVRARLS